MPNFGSPFGAGYGLGQIAAGVGQGMLRGTLEAPQLERERLQNQSLQMQVQGQQAENQAFSQAAPGEVAEGQQLTPYDNQLLRLTSAANQLEKGGHGLAAQQLHAQGIQLAQQQHQYMIGQAARLALGPDPSKAIPYLKGAGFGEPTRIDIDPETGQRIFVDPNHPDQSIRMSPQDLANIAADPSHLAQSLAMQSWYKGRLENQGRSLDIKEKQNELSNALRQASINQRDVASQRSAQARIQAAGISANTRKYIFDNGPNQKAFLNMTAPEEQGGMGMTDAQAIQSLDQARMAGANAAVQHGQAMRDFAKNNPGATAQQAIDYADQLTGGQAAPAVPRRAPGRPVAKQTAPLAAKPQVAPEEVIRQAKAAIASNPTAKQKILDRVKSMGVSTEGL